MRCVGAPPSTQARSTQPASLRSAHPRPPRSPLPCPHVTATAWARGERGWGDLSIQPEAQGLPAPPPPPRTAGRPPNLTHTPAAESSERGPSVLIPVMAIDFSFKASISSRAPLGGSLWKTHGCRPAVGPTGTPPPPARAVTAPRGPSSGHPHLLRPPQELTSGWGPPSREWGPQKSHIFSASHSPNGLTPGPSLPLPLSAPH